jgi:hypothetical protein
MDIQEGPTPRGFWRADFVDDNGKPCSLQESSIATDDLIWFGVTGEPGARTRMHLTREQVATLLPYLQRFVATGNLRPAPEAPHA